MQGIILGSKRPGIGSRRFASGGRNSRHARFRRRHSRYAASRAASGSECRIETQSGRCDSGRRFCSRIHLHGVLSAESGPCQIEKQPAFRTAAASADTGRWNGVLLPSDFFCRSASLKGSGMGSEEADMERTGKSSSGSRHQDRCILPSISGGGTGRETSHCGISAGRTGINADSGRERSGAYGSPGCFRTGGQNRRSPRRIWIKQEFPSG